MYVSNLGDLCASLDLAILTNFALKDTSFMMSCCKHPVDDKKEDFFAVRNNHTQVVLSESAMVSDCLDGPVAGGYKFMMSRNGETFVQVWVWLS